MRILVTLLGLRPPLTVIRVSRGPSASRVVLAIPAQLRAHGSATTAGFGGLARWFFLLSFFRG